MTDTDGNTDTTLSAGQYRITSAIKTLSSLKSITIATTVGNDVVTAEVLPTGT